MQGRSDTFTTVEITKKMPMLQQLLPLAFSWVGGTGHADEGVAEESTQAEAQRFLMILGLGHGERPAHCCNSLAIKEAA